MTTVSNPFVSPTPVKFGLGVSVHLGEEAKKLGMKKVFFVTDKGVLPISQNLVRNLEDAGLEVEIFSDVVPDPTAESINSAYQKYAQSKSDSLVAFGGGSSMDTAKAIGVLAADKGDNILDYVFGGSKTANGIPPLICLPTTAGTGSEVTFISIVATDSAKLLVRHPSIAPTLAIVDPKLNVGMPQALTASTGLDALCHAVESLTSTMSGPESGELAISAITRVLTWLPIAYKNGESLEARSEMSRAATDAGVAFLNGRVHLGHAVGHSFGANFKIPHGYACAVCLPAIVDFISNENSLTLEKVSKILKVEKLSDAIRTLMAQVNAPMLGELTGCGPSDIPKLVEMVESTEQRLIALSRVRPSQKDWEKIFQESF